MSLLYKRRNNVQLSDNELEILHLVNDVGLCSSEQAYEQVSVKYELLFVMRIMHSLVEKGFLERILINNKQLYKTARKYSYVKSYLRNQI
jgi:hypothetical protein